MQQNILINYNFFQTFETDKSHRSETHAVVFYKTKLKLHVYEVGICRATEHLHIIIFNAARSSKSIYT